MQIVTLTTDLGWRDPYVGMLKGSLLSKSGALLLVDLSHEVESYNILQGAYILKNAYRSFPKRSIHLLGVNTIYAERRRYLLAVQDGHYFLAPDNGVFSLLFEQRPEYLYELPMPAQVRALEMREIFAQAVAYINSQTPLSEWAKPTTDYLQRLALQPIIGRDEIRGTIIHVDSFGNVVLNIDRALFERVGQGRPFELYYKRRDPIRQIAHDYAAVEIGEALCFFNTAGYLELAVNMGRADELYSLAIDQVVHLIFLTVDK